MIEKFFCLTPALVPAAVAQDGDVAVEPEAAAPVAVPVSVTVQPQPSSRGAATRAVTTPAPAVCETLAIGTSSSLVFPFEIQAFPLNTSRARLGFTVVP